MAFYAGVFNLFAGAVASGAGLLELENGLAHMHGAAAATGGTHRGRSTRFGTAAVAKVAFFVGGNGDFFLNAVGGFFEADFDVVL